MSEDRKIPNLDDPKRKEFRKKFTSRFMLMVFGAGIFCNAAWMSLLQDWKGKEAYIKSVNENWISSSITVPVAIGIIVACLMIYSKFWTKLNIMLETLDGTIMNLFKLESIIKEKDNG